MPQIVFNKTQGTFKTLRIFVIELHAENGCFHLNSAIYSPFLAPSVHLIHFLRALSLSLALAWKKYLFGIHVTKL